MSCERENFVRITSLSLPSLPPFSSLSAPFPPFRLVWSDDRPLPPSYTRISSLPPSSSPDVGPSLSTCLVGQQTPHLLPTHESPPSLPPLSSSPDTDPSLLTRLVGRQTPHLPPSSSFLHTNLLPPSPLPPSSLLSRRRFLPSDSSGWTTDPSPPTFFLLPTHESPPSLPHLSSSPGTDPSLSTRLVRRQTPGRVPSGRLFSSGRAPFSTPFQLRSRPSCSGIVSLFIPLPKLSFQEISSRRRE